MIWCKCTGTIFPPYPDLVAEYHGQYELLYSTSSLAFPFSFIQLDYSPVTWLTDHPSLGGGLTMREIGQRIIWLLFILKLMIVRIHHRSHQSRLLGFLKGRELERIRVCLTMILECIFNFFNNFSLIILSSIYIYIYIYIYDVPVSSGYAWDSTSRSDETGHQGPPLIQ